MADLPEVGVKSFKERVCVCVAVPVSATTGTRTVVFQIKESLNRIKI